MNNRSLIFFDIDGTLLDEEHKIPDSTKEAIARLKTLGHEVAIATGRAPYMFDEIRDELEIRSHVSFNGQYVILDGEVIDTHPLNHSSLTQLTALSNQNGHPIVYLTDKQMYTSDPTHSHIVESLKALNQVILPTYENTLTSENIYQAMLFYKEDEDSLYGTHFVDLKFTRWHPVSVDVDPVVGSKARGIIQLAKALNIPRENLFAFGDGLNDLEMLEYIPFSVAMGNAHPDAKRVAKYVTKSVAEDGIYHGLKMVGLL